MTFIISVATVCAWSWVIERYNKSNPVQIDVLQYGLLMMWGIAWLTAGNIAATVAVLIWEAA